MLAGRTAGGERSDELGAGKLLAQQRMPAFILNVDMGSMLAEVDTNVRDDLLRMEEHPASVSLQVGVVI